MTVNHMVGTTSANCRLERLFYGLAMRFLWAIALLGLCAFEQPFVLAPSGEAAFCKRFKSECRHSTKTILPYSENLRKVLSLINVAVNARIKQVSDKEHYGFDELWTLPLDGKGDCEDIQLLKRKRLAAAGVPRGAMLLTVVNQQNVGGHAILVIKTDKGDFALDNIRDEILPINETGYVLVKQQTADRRWISLAGNK